MYLYLKVFERISLQIIVPRRGISSEVVQPQNIAWEINL